MDVPFAVLALVVFVAMLAIVKAAYYLIRRW